MQVLRILELHFKILNPFPLLNMYFEYELAVYAIFKCTVPIM